MFRKTVVCLVWSTSSLTTRPTILHWWQRWRLSSHDSSPNTSSQWSISSSMSLPPPPTQVSSPCLRARHQRSFRQLVCAVMSALSLIVISSGHLVTSIAASYVLLSCPRPHLMPEDCSLSWLEVCRYQLSFDFVL